jgi:hypothetical protein
MREKQTPSDGAIGSAERAGLSLVFGGPVWLWIAMARIVGVRVDAQPILDDELLARAERDAHAATAWFTAGLIATFICLGALGAWSPTQAAMMEDVMHVEFHAVTDGAIAGGMHWLLAVTLASAVLVATGLAVGMANATVFGGIPLYLLRRSTVAAAPAVSVALAHRAGALAEGRLVSYPRVEIAVERVLTTRRRGIRA